MEGAGEGMVAVVEGLPDSGLAVTLGRRQARRRPTISDTVHHGQLTQARSSVETSTNGLPVAPSIDTAAQICDDRYTSSYQLAHCRARPSSPPVVSTEFPPQRAEPCRTLGNFEIGGIGSGEVYPTVQVTRSPHFLRDSYTSVDRGLMTNSRVSRCSEAFVHSLRKYPSISPNRSISTDLVQRILTYTQAKGFNKSSHHSRSMRCLRHKHSESPKDSTTKAKISKSVQTYTRTKRGKETAPSGSRERDKDGRSVRDGSKSPKAVRSRSPNESRTMRHNSSLLNATYDYLKASSARFSARADVRYLTDVTRCLRDTLRQICDDRPLAAYQVCPNMQNRYSQHRREHHRRGIGVESSSESNNMEAQASMPMVSTGVPVMSSCEAIPGTYQQTCPSRPKICCYCRKPLPCTCRSSLDQRYPYSRGSFDSRTGRSSISEPSDDFPKKLEEAVMGWLNEIPVYANDNPAAKATRENMARNLIEKLKALRGDANFEQKTTAAIAECVNNLPNMWSPDNKDDQDKFKQQMIDNLASKIFAISKDKDKFQDEISKWVDNLNFRCTSDVDKQSVIDNLVNRLKPIVLNPPSDLKTALKNKIVEVLQELPIIANGNKSAVIDKIADNLADKLQKIPAKDIKSVSVDLGEEYQKLIWDWLQDVPELTSASASSISNNPKLVESLAKNLQKIQAQGIDSPGTQEQMQNAVNEWLEENTKRGRLDSRTKGKLVDKLMGKLVDASKKALSGKVKGLQAEASLEDMAHEILDWLEDIPELTGGSEAENRKMIDGLAKKLHKLRTEGKDDTELEDEILNWLTDAFEEKGERLDVRTQSKLIDKLLGKIVKLSTVKDLDNLVREILNCFEDMPDFDMNIQENKKIVEDLAKSIKDFQSQTEDADQDQLREQIADGITDLARNSGVKINNNLKNQIIKKLMDIVVTAPKQRRRWSKQQSPQKVMNSIKEEVGYVLDKSNIPPDNRDEIESVLTDILNDQVMRGEDESQTKDRIMSALADFDFSQEMAEEIADKLTDIGKEMSLSYKTQDSTIFSDRRSSELSPMQKEMFQNSAQAEILDFLEEISGDTSATSKRKFKAAALDLAEKAGDIMSELGTPRDEKRENIESEISKYLKNLSIQTDEPIEEQASQLADRLENLSFKTSTPKRSSLDKEISFRPQRESKGWTMSSIDDASHMMQTPTPSKEEQKYMNQLVGIIDGWLKNLPIDLESDEGKGFKDIMIKDLAGDIIDRQKYLQLNPEAKTSDAEELEHLKYQVFRWLNKLPDVKNLMPSISKTDDLMNRIKGIKVPQLVKPTERRSSNGPKGTRESAVQHVAKDLSSLQNEIIKWFEAIPAKYLSTKDKKRQKEMLTELADQIDQYKKDSKLTESIFEEVVSEFLDKTLQGAIDKYVSSLKEGLKAVLTNKKLISLISSTPLRKPSISADGVKNASGKPIQPGKSRQVDQLSKKGKEVSAKVQPEDLGSKKSDLQKGKKNYLEKSGKIDLEKGRKTDLEKNLKKDTGKSRKDNFVKSRKQDQSLSDEIDDTDKSTTTESQSMAAEMMGSKSGYKKAADVLYDNIEEWCEDLPIQEGKTPQEKEKVKTLKQNIASKLFNIIGDLNMKPEIFNDDSLYEDVLNNEIDNLLSTLPPSPELENNLPVLKDNLIEKVLEVKQKTQDELAGQAYKQQLRDAISKTLPSVDDLTLEEQAPFEVLKDNLADAYIELHHAAENNEVKGKLKKRISGEIYKFCDDYLKRNPSSPVDPKQLNRELYNVLQKVPVPKDETIKNQVEEGRMKEEINEWINELPLRQDETPMEKLQRNKIVTYLAKRLHDIEKEKEFDPEVDVEEKMKKEIMKWIKKLPIEPEEEDRIEEMVNQLTERLKNSEESRKFSVSHIRHSTDFAEEDQSPKTSIQPSPRKRFLSQYTIPFPQCTLSTEDRAHLQRIRERNEQQEQCCKALISPCMCKDASVSPIPIDEGSQTDIEKLQWQSSSSRSMQRGIPCQPMPPPCSQIQNQPTSPHVVVKEYYWDSPESTMDQPYVPCTSSEEQGYPDQSLYLPQYRNSWPQSLDQSRRFSNAESVCPRLPVDQSGQSQPSPSMYQSPPYMPGQEFMQSQPPQSYTQQPQPSMEQAFSPQPCMQPPRMKPQPPCQIPQPCMKPPPPCVLPPQPCMPPPPPCMSPPEPCMPPPCEQPYMPRPSPQQSLTSLRSPCQIPPPIPCMPPPKRVPDPPPCRSPPPRMAPPPCRPPPTCMPPPPCMSSGQSMRRPRPPPCLADRSSYTIPKSPCSPRPCQNRERNDTRGKPFNSPDISSTSSPFETDGPNISSFGPRVTRLGSLDNVPCSKNCSNQSPNPKRSRACPNEDFDWTIGFPDETDFWGSTCPRRRVQRSPPRDGSFIKEKERKEEKVRCRCRSRVTTRCVRPGCDDELHRCSKCCGAHCPHPSYLFFR